ncbi:hypothetical protein [Staphylococcus aureus]|uniref:hypothetical protein n=1 Tax=Staphylococcus aureus TaxID=1280 RepID=UPI000DA84B3A|nr:hypothetical protein [Staphylococcus aureus]PZH51766.1 hypothetical protein C7Q64_12365 [Staphylococcus aureus]
MQKSKAIKELFKIQDNENKFKIIKNYDLKIKGFSNITLDFIEQNEKYISNQIATTQNIKKITNIIKNNKKNEQNLDYLLSIDKISEKYNKDFDGLITIFENDKYGELTEKIISNFMIDNSPIKYENTNKNENKESILRNIIQSLESKIQKKEKKNNELLKLKKELKKKNRNWEDLTVKLKETIKVKKYELKEIKEVLQNNINELEQLKEKSNSKESDSLPIKNNNETAINIIGAPGLWKLESTENIYFYNEDEIDNFISNYNNENSRFYVVNFGVTSYSARKLKKQTHAIFINNKDEYIKIIKGE